MAEQQQTRAIVVPPALGQVIAVNVEFKVLLCIQPSCRKAVSPPGAVKHLLKIYKEKPGIQKQVQEFVTRIL
jgi:hypothetical protein